MLFLLLIYCIAGVGLGCGPPTAPVVDGVVHKHAAGFSIVVTDDWQVQSTPRCMRFVARQPQDDGYPTMRIEIIDPEQVPDDFLKGRSISWSGGQGSYRYGRWANALGHGFSLTVFLSSPQISLEVEATVWDERLLMRRDFFEENFWPMIRSIELVDAANPS